MRNTLHIFGLGTGLMLGASFVTLAAAATLDVKTGLWEMSSVGETSGAPPIPPEALAKMTPEQRVRIQAAMGAASQPQVNRVCISEKMLQRGFNPKEPTETHCTRTVLNNTSRQVDVRMECNGASKMSGTFHFEAVDRQTMRGNFDMAVNRDTNTMTMKRTMQGKWLGSDCGDVKPNEE